MKLGEHIHAPRGTNSFVFNDIITFPLAASKDKRDFFFFLFSLTADKNAQRYHQYV